MSDVQFLYYSITSPQPLPQVGGAKNIKIIWLPSSLLGEGGGGRGK